MVLKLIRDECYTDLNHFYANVASRMDFRNIDELRFDCRDILVTTFIKNVISDYYITELGASLNDMTFIWACFGPKTDITPYDIDEVYRVEVGRKFIIQEEY